MCCRKVSEIMTLENWPKNEVVRANSKFLVIFSLVLMEWMFLRDSSDFFQVILSPESLLLPFTVY